MAQHHLPRSKGKLPHRALPVAGGAGNVDLADDDVDRPVEDVVLVPHVAIQRHRLDPELLPELAHAQRVDAVAIREVDGGPKDALLGQRRATFCDESGFGHLTSLRCSATFTP